ncbi:MAG: SUMF1/EgtB/PvdO family nonheme iron enzyme [Pseudomonadota bacterium]
MSRKIDLADQTTSSASCSCAPTSVIATSPAGNHYAKDDTIKPSLEKPEFASFTGGHTFAGTNNPIILSDGEGPRRWFEVRPFDIALTTVTNKEFERFIKVTGYVTDAERSGSSFVFHNQISPDADDHGAIYGTEWWHRVGGACWSNVGGSRSATVIDPAHPVVHVSWNDAAAYSNWVGGRLPTEVEWECAARSGTSDTRYPWGDEDPPEGGGSFCNIWHGEFPVWSGPSSETVGTRPARSSEPNASGIFNMCGNVWEWTADHYSNRMGQDMTRRILKGGSFLCHWSYCFRYRIAARIGSPALSTTSHQGFRIAFDG